MRALLSRAISIGFIAGFALAVGAGGPQPVQAGGSCRGFSSTEGFGNVVKMNDSCFLPTVLHVAAGTTVSFENGSAQPHSVAGATLEWGNYNELRDGQSTAYTFDKAGTYPYYCFVHSGMTAAIVVGDGVGSSVSLPPVEKLAQAVVAANTAKPEPAAASAPANVSASASDADSRTTLLAGGLGALFGAVAVMAGLGMVSLRRR